MMVRETDKNSSSGSPRRSPFCSACQVRVRTGEGQRINMDEERDRVVGKETGQSVTSSVVVYRERLRKEIMRPVGVQ